MVLKKSNTPFNSGATQKCFSRSAYKAVVEKPSGEWLTITLKGLPPKFDECIEHANALEKIYDYLEFVGPNMKTFHETPIYLRQRAQRSLSFPLNKHGMWHIPERVDSLMTEMNFLNEECGFAQIRVTKVQNIADRTTIHKKETSVLNPEAKRKWNRSRQRNNNEIKGNRRGVQRPHLLTQEREDEDFDYEDYYWGLYKKKIVHVELQVEDQIDARILGYRPKREISYDCFGYVQTPAKRHTKPQQVKRGIKTTVSEMMDSEQWWQDIDWYQNQDDEAVDDCGKYDTHQGQLGDYLVFSTENHSPKKKRKSANHTGRGHTDDDTHFVSVNPASSRFTLRHPKGSFQFIERPCDGIVDTTRDTSSVENGMQVDKSQVDEMQLNATSVQTKSQETSEKTSMPKTMGTFETHDNLVAINVQFPKLIQETLMGSLLPPNDNGFSIHGCSFVLGNCYPPVFSVSLVHKDLGSNTEWSLVGTSFANVSNNKNLKWEIILKNTKSSRAQDNTKNTFFNNLAVINFGTLQFDDLVKIALNSVQSDLCNAEKDKSVSPPICGDTHHNGDLFTTSKLDSAPSPDVRSMEEAVVRLRAVETEKEHNSTPFLSATKRQISMSSENVECDIFFNICDTFGQKDAGIIKLDRASTSIPDVRSIDEAVATIRAVENEKVHNSTPLLSIYFFHICYFIYGLLAATFYFITSARKRQISRSNESVECDICLNICDTFGQKDAGIITLLPCNHSFCSECWRSHIFYHLMSGDTEIKCMHTDCKETLNETMMKALIPENYLSKLYLRRQEKCIDTSPLCQWCPRTKCNKVAMIYDTSPHVQQFGCCVVCDCGSCWCFSCQSQPHWPVSCSQAAAYRKLVLKSKDEIPMDVTCNVDLKPCPGCRYPIQKDEGCPHMVCSMCKYHFCWNCLQHIDDHPVFKCTEDENSNFQKYQLHNNVVNNFPLKFFSNALDLKKKLTFVRKDTVRGWLMGLDNVDCSKIKLSFQQSVQLEEAGMVKIRAINLARESVRFIMDSYIFLEYFYILYSFALLNEDKENSGVFHLSTQRMGDRLVSTALRLEECIVGKSCRQLLVVEERCHIMLAAGREMLEKLKGRVTSFQKLSKDVPAEPIGHLDPKAFYELK